jgi:hypothetical protein
LKIEADVRRWMSLATILGLLVLCMVLLGGQTGAAGAVQEGSLRYSNAQLSNPLSQPEQDVRWDCTHKRQGQTFVPSRSVPLDRG